ncbi:hypothetical protein BDF19DRAFT_438716 [Syncephalis fuscata]|nr:hypothetical protein BDF19DRAFT_438716 [Syncephalis fuscata]
MRFSRFLTATLAVATCLFAGVDAGIPSVDAQGCSIRVRQDIKRLNRQQLDAFFSALRTLVSLPRPNSYDAAHGTAWFLPWHRLFIRSFEYQLQRIDPSVMLPYWDWSVTSQAPDNDIIFSPTWFGGNGRKSDGCVMDGQLARWRTHFPQPYCLQRRFNGGSRLGSFYSPEALRIVADEAANYAEFNARLESPAHNLVHINIGGHMVTSYSPNDPIFYIHHSFIDMQWALWQARSSRNARDYGGRNADNSPANINDVLTPFNVRVGDIMDTRSLCYVYDRLANLNENNNSRFSRRGLLDHSLFGISTGISTGISNSIGANVGASIGSSLKASIGVSIGHTIHDIVSSFVEHKLIKWKTKGQRSSKQDIDEIYQHKEERQADDLEETDRKHIISLRTCTPLREEIIRRQNLNGTLIRETETMLRELVIRLNKQPGYISPAAIINNQELLTVVAAEQSTVYVARGNTQVPVSVPRAENGQVNVTALVTAANTKLAALDEMKQQELSGTNSTDVYTYSDSSTVPIDLDNVYSVILLLVPQLN